MVTFTAGDITLERVREYVWEIERSGEMRVPARVFASEELLEQIADDMTLQQLKNTTHLPGIQKYAICMPDGHQGYGFPVGGVAGIDAHDGCISPGAVGYDINCLTGTSSIQLSFGRRRNLEGLVEDFEEWEATVATEDGLEPSNICLVTKTDGRIVYELETVTGDTIEATADHPFATPVGEKPLRDLEPGDLVTVQPFVGLQADDPPEFIVLDEDDLAGEDPRVIEDLEQRGLVPLRSTDDAFNRLLKLVGYHTGNGSFRDDYVWFSGDPATLEAIRADIEAVGYPPSRISDRSGTSEIDGMRFDRGDHRVSVPTRGFRVLLRKLGAPGGKNDGSDATVPAYLDRLADWQRALYLSAFFGAEMSAPTFSAPKNVDRPSLSHDRRRSSRDSGEAFVRELMQHLEDIGIATTQLEEVDRGSSAASDTVRFRFGVDTTPENLIRFFTRVGYRYHKDKQVRATLAAQYLKLKNAVLDDRGRAATETRAHADGGIHPTDMDRSAAIGADGSSERRRYRGSTGRPRSPADFPDFAEYCATTSIDASLAIPTPIKSIERRGEKPVYDIGVSHDEHNFIANGFIVSNCGVRMLKTDLEYDDINGREEELVDELFNEIPSGLGKGGVVESSVSTVEAILDGGLQWALEEGYATERDLRHCEDEGVREESDAGKVSTEAKQRGKNQIGSLGSGNHFLEVQRVTDVFLEDVAADFGLYEDQIVVLIHCGSRGLGHQTCTDYLRKVEQRHAGLLDRLPDRELAAAPAGSQLADDYYQAMGAAINFAWTNRQLVMHGTRTVFERVFGTDWEGLGMELLYDVAHNIAKKEVHDVAGEDRELYVHRKGATRSFPAGRPEVPRAYRDVGQPVIIPGSMGSGSYVLRGGRASMDLSFGSTAHGAGRIMSRTQAKKQYWGGDVQTDLREQQHVYVKAQSGATIAEEAPGVYKNVDEVVRVSGELGIGDPVARTFPVCNIKG